MYHRGEIAVQTRAGVREHAERAQAVIREAIPEVAAAFLAEQPMIVLGGAEGPGEPGGADGPGGAGRIWATLLAGEPGFIRAPNPLTVTVDATPSAHDPLAHALGRPAKVGMIAVSPATRRRMRVNGLAHPTRRGLRIDVHQVISNCPKYIQRRDFRLLPPEERLPASVRGGPALTPGQQLAISTADTFFIATATPDGDADASHRGGNPGFVQVLSPTHLRWPDYAGNAMFLTLGNLALNPAAGLLFPDWRNGSLLHLTGVARTGWAAGEAARVPGAERLVDFLVGEVREIAHAVPLGWTRPDYSRHNPPVAPAGD
ncbi:pyridoxamine 5'-phosphate oxidase family protein [Streptomyces sp. PR69]|uniref:pyridoxamine 5'-phosphate oxidase family protein n=1 Tax=Streptomyces sp. PR69 TaxID=2984950 RepID=UPI002264C7C0|nr:pyridoxamine 5'-phosphate oxidase family protein [Streptomyces sp. PR69]